MKVKSLVDGEKFVAIDLGSFSLKVAIYCLTDGKIKCISYKEDLEVNINSPEEKIVHSLMHVREAFPDATNCGISISPTKSFVRYIKTPKISDEKREKYFVAFEVSENIPFEIEDVLWDYEIYKSNNDGFDCKLSVVKKEDIYPIIRSVELIGFKISFIETELESVTNLMVYNAKRFNYAETICSINIGHKSTVISLFNRRTMKTFVRTVPFAGETVIREISYKMGVSESFSCDSINRIDLMLKREKQEYAHIVSYDTVRSLFSKLCNEINKTVSIYKVFGGAKPDIILISGGMAKVNGISEFFKRQLEVETFVFEGNPEMSVLDGISYRVHPEFKCLCDVNLYDRNKESSKNEDVNIINGVLPEISRFILKKIKMAMINQSISIKNSNKSYNESYKEDISLNDCMSKSNPINIKKYLPEYKAPETDVRSPEDRMLRALYKFSYDLSGSSDIAEKFYLMLHGFFHKGN